jgi:hypothetical protein
MSYIGATPTIGGYHKLDTITTDGSASYTMQLNSGNFVPESVNHLIVSVNGVIQAPTDSFTVSGSTITFASSLSVSDTIDFIMALGNVLDIGVPSDATVSLSKLTATGTKDATTFLRGDNTFATPSGGTNTPAFSARETGQQQLLHNTTTNLTFGTEEVDTDNAFASNVFTVPSGKGGLYYLESQVNFYDNGQNITQGTLWIWKGTNSTPISKMYNLNANDVNKGHLSFQASVIENLSAGDVIGVAGLITTSDGGDTDSYGAEEGTRFMGFKLIT